MVSEHWKKGSNCAHSLSNFLIFSLFLFSTVSCKKIPVLYNENFISVFKLGRRGEHLESYTKIIVMVYGFLCQAKALMSSTTGCSEGFTLDLFVMIYTCSLMCMPQSLSCSVLGHVGEMVSWTFPVFSFPVKMECFLVALFFFTPA